MSSVVSSVLNYKCSNNHLIINQWNVQRRTFGLRSGLTTSLASLLAMTSGMGVKVSVTLHPRHPHLQISQLTMNIVIIVNH